MSKIYYAVTPCFCSVTRYAEEGDFQRIYDLIFQITQNHNDSANISSWCELAAVGEVFRNNLLTVEIIED